jgi:tRNA (uracil-5-)-methyltransferase TRM9
MDPHVVLRLLDLNRAFYTEFAESFSATRSAPWPGYTQLLPHLSGGARILDIGCGNGRMARFLDANLDSGTYLGLDFSEPMLAEARRSSQHLLHIESDFRSADISRREWTATVPEAEYDAVLMLAVLQHIPSFELRASIVSQVVPLLAPQGVLVMSHWQFMESDRLRRRVVRWTEAEMAESDLEPGDYLLEWRRGGVACRYCHLLDESEVRALADRAALDVVQAFRADGPEGNLNLYALLALPSHVVPDAPLG